MPVLGEPLTMGQESIPGSAQSSRKVVVVLSFLIGLTFAVLFSPVLFDRSSDLMFQEPADTMLFGAQVASPARSVVAMQNTLKMHGIPSSPTQKLALSALVAPQGLAIPFSTMDAGTQRSLRAAAEAKDMAGVTAPMGFWDPWGLSTDTPEGELLFYREIELQHGRIGMLATLGIIMGEKFAPIFGGTPNVPAGFVIDKTAFGPFWLAVLIAVGTAEGNKLLTFGSIDKFSAEATKEGWKIGEGRVPGDFGFDPLGLKPKDAKALLELQNKELNNGRLAMLAAAGIVAQEWVTGKSALPF